MTPAERVMDEHVRRTVDAAPPLMPDQVRKLRSLLAPSPEAAAEIQARNADVRRKLLDPEEWADIAAYDDYISSLTDKVRPLSAEERGRIAAELAPIREKIAHRSRGSI